MNDEMISAPVYFFIAFMGWAILFGGVGYAIGSGKNRGAEGFVLGFFFAVIGWILTALLSEKGDKCPECLGVVPRQARKCKHCGSDLERLPVQRIATPASETFYVLRGEKTEGPFSKPQLKALIETGALKYSTLCAREGDAEWQPAEVFI